DPCLRGGRPRRAPRRARRDRPAQRRRARPGGRADRAPRPPRAHRGRLATAAGPRPADRKAPDVSDDFPLLDQLRALEDRFREVEAMLADPEVIADQATYQPLLR